MKVFEVPVLAYQTWLLKDHCTNLPAAGLYGSGILNNKFLERFRSFMELNNISSIPRGQRREATATSRPAIESEAMKEFEKKKRSFGDDQDKKLSRPMFIRIPGLEDRYDRLQRPLGFGGIDIPR